ncbi:hypothetical protein D3C72_1405040 [compost metagenome]
MRFEVQRVAVLCHILRPAPHVPGATTGAALCRPASGFRGGHFRSSQSSSASIKRRQLFAVLAASAGVARPVPPGPVPFRSTNKSSSLCRGVLLHDPRPVCDATGWMPRRFFEKRTSRKPRPSSGDCEVSETPHIFPAAQMHQSRRTLPAAESSRR